MDRGAGAAVPKRPTSPPYGIEGLLGRDRWIVLSTLGLIVTGCWAYLLAGVDMSGMGHAMEGMHMPWTLAHSAAMAAMWTSMMAAMMLPSATPMILLFAAVGRKTRAEGGPPAPVWLFGLGYLLVWTGFALVAAGLQWALDRAMLLSPDMALAARPLAGALLVLAGVYQLTPLKNACLRQCRSPMAFVMTRWRTGGGGALRMGSEHGLFCLGCCWCLMLLLFVGGVMNVVWIVALTLYVLAEKTLFRTPWLERAGAAALIVWGLAVLALSRVPVDRFPANL